MSSNSCSGSFIVKNGQVSRPPPVFIPGIREDIALNVPTFSPARVPNRVVFAAWFYFINCHFRSYLISATNKQLCIGACISVLSSRAATGWWVYTIHCIRALLYTYMYVMQCGNMQSWSFIQGEGKDWAAEIVWTTAAIELITHSRVCFHWVTNTHDDCSATLMSSFPSWTVRGALTVLPFSSVPSLLKSTVVASITLWTKVLPFYYKNALKSE